MTIQQLIELMDLEAQIDPLREELASVEYQATLDNYDWEDSVIPERCGGSGGSAAQQEALAARADRSAAAVESIQAQLQTLEAKAAPLVELRWAEEEAYRDQVPA